MLSERVREQRRLRNRTRIRHFGTMCGILAAFFGSALFITLSIRLTIPFVGLTAGAIVAYTSVWLGELEDRLTRPEDTPE